MCSAREAPVSSFANALNPTSTAMSVLSRSVFSKHFTAHQLLQFAECFQLESVAAGHVFYSKGQKVNSFYLLAKGQVRVDPSEVTGFGSATAPGLNQNGVTNHPHTHLPTHAQTGEHADPISPTAFRRRLASADHSLAPTIIDPGNASAIKSVGGFGASGNHTRADSNSQLGMPDLNANTKTAPNSNGKTLTTTTSGSRPPLAPTSGAGAGAGGVSVGGSTSPQAGTINGGAASPILITRTKTTLPGSTVFGGPTGMTPPKPSIMPAPLGPNSSALNNPPPLAMISPSPVSGPSATTTSSTSNGSAAASMSSLLGGGGGGGGVGGVDLLNNRPSASTNGSIASNRSNSSNNSGGGGGMSGQTDSTLAASAISIRGLTVNTSPREARSPMIGSSSAGAGAGGSGQPDEGFNALFSPGNDASHHAPKQMNFTGSSPNGTGTGAAGGLPPHPRSAGKVRPGLAISPSAQAAAASALYTPPVVSSGRAATPPNGHGSSLHPATNPNGQRIPTPPLPLALPHLPPPHPMSGAARHNSRQNLLSPQPTSAGAGGFNHLASPNASSRPNSRPNSRPTTPDRLQEKGEREMEKLKRDRERYILASRHGNEKALATAERRAAAQAALHRPPDILNAGDLNAFFGSALLKESARSMLAAMNGAGDLAGGGGGAAASSGGGGGGASTGGTVGATVSTGIELNSLTGAGGGFGSGLSTPTGGRIHQSTATAVTACDVIVLSRYNLQRYYMTYARSGIQELLLRAISPSMESSLRNIPFMAGISNLEIRDLAAMFHHVALDEHDILFREGELDRTDGNSMFFLHEGLLNIFVKDPQDPRGERDVLVNTLGPGNFIGEVGLLMDLERTATITAREPCVLLELKQKDFRDFVVAVPEIVSKFKTKIVDYNIALKHMIKNPFILKYVIRHCSAEYSTENIEFWMSAKDFRTNTADCSDQELLSKAGELINGYIVSDAPKQVNLDGALQARLLKRWNDIKSSGAFNTNNNTAPGSGAITPTTAAQLQYKSSLYMDLRTMFVAAEDEILRLMSTDSYGRFTSSDLFKQCLDEASQPYMEVLRKLYLI